MINVDPTHKDNSHMNHIFFCLLLNVYKLIIILLSYLVNSPVINKDGIQTKFRNYDYITILV